MSNPLNRTYSLRKRIRPMADIEEEDENERRDSSGRKRVEVVDCLLDSSADELDNDIINVEMPTNILWLTFNEICHIRYVLVQTSLTTDKQYSDLRNGRLCFRCRKSLNLFFFLPSFLRFNNYEICFICKQMICKKCSYYSFIPPASKLTIPMRIQSLIKSSSVTLNDKKDKITKTNAQSRTVCLDCLQVNLTIIKDTNKILNDISACSRSKSTYSFKLY